MLSKLDLTFRQLSTTANTTAIEVLLHALDVTKSGVREHALRAVLSRRNPAAHREVLRRWGNFNERAKKIIGERQGRISSAIREAILSHDKALYLSGCDAVIWAREYDLMPALCNAAEDRANEHAEVAAKTLLAMAEMLNEEITSPATMNHATIPS